MKFFHTLFPLLLSFSLFGQKNECSILINGGLPLTQHYSKNPSSLEYSNYRKAFPTNDFGASLNYQRVIWKRLSLNLSSEIQFSRMTYVFPVVDWYESYRNLENRRFAQNRLNYRLGLRKCFYFIDSAFALQLGVDLVYRHYLPKENYYSADHSDKNDWVGYTYELNTYAGEHYYNDLQIPTKQYNYLNTEFLLGVKLPLKNNISLSVNLNYSRNHFLFYNYRNEFFYYTNGSTTPSYSLTDNGLQGAFNPKFVLRDHFIHLQSGITYHF